MRARLAAAQQEAAKARSASDPVEALDAVRHAEEAIAIADHGRLIEL
ncbi:MAG: hypothetical protein QM622_03910 [Microbacterium sp.]